jgi:hypothetical protein
MRILNDPKHIPEWIEDRRYDYPTADILRCVMFRRAHIN